MNFFIWMLDFSQLLFFFFCLNVWVCVFVCVLVVKIRRGEIVRYARKNRMGNQTPSCVASEKRKEKEEHNRFTGNVWNRSRVFCAFIIGVSLQLHLASSTHTYRHTYSFIHSLIYSHIVVCTPKNKCTEKKSNGFPFCIRFLLSLRFSKVFFF